jgi:hypothetical protein
VKVKFEKRLHARAKEAAKELRDLLTKEEYLEHVGKLNDDFINGKYSFESPAGMESIKATAGMNALASIMFGIPEAEMMKLVTAAADEVTAVMHTAFKMSFPGVKEDDAVEDDDGEKKVPSVSTKS